jgi:hypothetical protein
VIDSHRGYAHAAERSVLRKERTLSLTWLSWTFAAVMIATVLYHVSRLMATDTSLREVDVDVTHAAMGVGMAGMLIGRLTPGESYWWALGFAVPMAWFATRITWTALGRGVRFVGNHLRQLLVSGAMVFMLGAVAATAGTASVGASPVGNVSMAGMTMATSPSSTSSMALPMPHLGGSGVSSSSRLLDVLLTLAILVVAAWMSVIVVRRLRARGRHGTLTPALGASCQLAMNVATVYMLVLML